MPDQEAILDALRTVKDPELSINVVDLGLVYAIQTRDDQVDVEMTLTSPACPVAGTLPGEVEARVRDVPGVTDVEVELVWEPSWSPERMSEAAKLELGFL